MSRRWLDAGLMTLGGALFGAGLAYSGMIHPEVVLQFLLLRDLGLMLVMGGAVLVTMMAYQLLPRWRQRPLLGGAFEQRVALMDRNTMLGAALFGLGWGVCGVCPGPAIAGLGAGNGQLLWALAGIAAGAYLHGWWASRRLR